MGMNWDELNRPVGPREEMLQIILGVFVCVAYVVGIIFILTLPLWVWLT